MKKSMFCTAARLSILVFSAFSAVFALGAGFTGERFADIDLDENPVIVTNVTFDGLATLVDITNVVDSISTNFVPALRKEIADASKAGTNYVDSATNLLSAAIDEKYDKQADGIPKGDLSAGVQASLDKADTAVQPAVLSGYKPIQEPVGNPPESSSTAYNFVSAITQDVNGVIYATRRRIPTTTNWNTSSGDGSATDALTQMGIGNFRKTVVCDEWYPGTNYLEGAFVLLRSESKCYICTNAHVSASLWTAEESGNWSEATVADVLAALCTGKVSTNDFNTATNNINDTIQTLTETNATLSAAISGLETKVDGKQDKLPYPTNAIPQGAVSGLATALAGKATKADATLTERGFSAWVFEPATYDGERIWMNVAPPEGVQDWSLHAYRPYAGDHEIGGFSEVEEGDPNVTRLVWASGEWLGEGELVATRKKREGYQLGDQDSKLLAPAESVKVVDHTEYTAWTVTAAGGRVLLEDGIYQPKWSEDRRCWLCVLYFRDDSATYGAWSQPMSGEQSEDATSIDLYDRLSGDLLAQATRTATPNRGYQIGDQSDKPLQPAGDYVLSSRTVNGHALTNDVTLTGADIPVNATAGAQKMDAALAGKASKADATLNKRGTNHDGFSDWFVVPVYPSGYTSYTGPTWVDAQSVWVINFTGHPDYPNIGEMAAGSRDSLSLEFLPSGTTATRTVLEGYMLGDQYTRPLASEIEAEALRAGKLDKADVVAPSTSATTGQAAGAKATGDAFALIASDWVQTSAYSAYDCVKYNGAYYYAKADIAANTAWNANNWGSLANLAAVIKKFLPLTGGTVVAGANGSGIDFSSDLEGPIIIIKDENGRTLSFRTFKFTAKGNDYFFPVTAGYLASLANIAPNFSTSSTYALNALCVYEGVLYRCSTAITTAEWWTPAHWTEAKVEDVLAALRTGKADRAPNPTVGHLAALDANGNPTDSGIAKINVLTKGTLSGETMPSSPTQNELAEAVKKIFTALGGTVTP